MAVRRFAGHTSWIRTLAVSPDGLRLASGSSDGVIHLWDLTSGERLTSCLGHTDQVLSVRFHPEGGRLVSGSADETLRIWEPAGGRSVATLRTEGSTPEPASPGSGGWPPPPWRACGRLGPGRTEPEARVHLFPAVLPQGR